MWPQSSFGMNGPFTGGFNQEDFLYSSKPYQNASGPLEQHFSGQQPDNLAEIGATNGQTYHGFTKNGFPSETEVSNQLNLDMNTHTVKPILQGAPRPLSTTQSTNPRPSALQMSSRAAELRAQLLAGRTNQQNSPVSQPSTKPVSDVNVNGARKENPQVPSSSHQPPNTPSSAENQDKQLNLSELISQYSDSKSRTEAKNSQESSRVVAVKPSTPINVPPKETQSPGLKSNHMSKKNNTISKKKSNIKLNNNDLGRKNDTKVSETETSEGEIVENAETKKDIAARDLKEVSARKINSKNDERSLRTSFMDLTTIADENLSPQEGSTLHFRESPVSPKLMQRKVDKSPYNDPRSEEKNYPVGPKSEQKSKLNPEKHNQSRHDYRAEESQKPELCLQSGRTESIRQKQLSVRERESRVSMPPTLQDVLLYDVDLREWLEVTGYHNKQYRDKILERRRAIAALDAQREKLIAEIEAEERGGIPIQSQPFSSSMLPPPIPISKPGDRLGTTQAVPYERYNVASNKRSLSQTQDYWLENGPGKIARTDMNYNLWNKDELSSESRRPRSSGHDTVNRLVLDHYDDSSRANANSTRESPVLVVHERRSPARISGYENDPYDEDEISETGTRSFEGRRSHRGRAFDPKNRGRGRARGRGEIRDPRDSPEPRGEISSSNLKATNGRPNKNARGASRGSRGNH